MSLYGQYIAEREGKHILESDKGFAVYQFFGEECYVSDIFVAKEFRRTKVAWEMLDKIVELAKQSDCRYLTGTINLNSSGSTASLKAHLAYGFEIHSASNNVLCFKKEI